MVLIFRSSGYDDNIYEEALLYMILRLSNGKKVNKELI